MNISPRFCGSCGASLTPGGAFCGACGSAVAGPSQPAAAAPPHQPPAPPAAAPPANQPPAPPVAAAPSPQPPAAPAPPAYAPAYAPPAQPAAPSLAIEPDEIVLNRWSVNCAPPYGRLVVGKLIVTNRRVLFNPQTNAGGVVSMLFSLIGRAAWKRKNTLIIDKTQILHAEVEPSILGPRAVLHLADGLTVRFDRGVVLGVDEVVAAIQRR